MTKLKSLAFLTLLSGILAASPVQAERVAEPPFTIVQRFTAFEIRDYQTQVIAEVNVTGNLNEASNRGFNPLAGYIFGGNAPRNAIATGAVTTAQRGTKIAMTAPVTRQARGETWKVRFIMPAGSRLATMPVPNNPNVRLSEEPARRYAVIQFSGLGGEAAFNSKTENLRQLLSSENLTPVGAPVFASYDPPWTLPPFRRNEVWLELSKP